MRGVLVVSCAAAVAACGPSEREQFERVEGAVQRARQVPSTEPEAIRAAADALATLNVDHPKARAARDACAASETDRATMYELMDRIERELRDPPVESPQQVAEWYRRVDELQLGLGARQERCSQALGELWTGR